jgi:secreted PhoX family phosphatase
VVVVPKTGDILLQEDGGGDQFMRGVTLDGKIYDFAKGLASDSEFCGGCFDPDGETLYVSQQGGRPSPAAVTYAIFGPFAKRRG